MLITSNMSSVHVSACVDDVRSGEVHGTVLEVEQIRGRDLTCHQAQSHSFA